MFHFPRSIILNDFFYVIRTDPEYYDVVTLPIDLLRIQHKLKSEDYEEIEQLTSDIELMVNNAKAFYKVCQCLLEQCFSTR